LLVNAPGQSLQDGFYGVDVNDTTRSTAPCPDCLRFNRVSEGTCGVCSTECASISHRIADLLVDPYPAFSPTHQYTVRLNLGAAPPDRLNIGMADCGCFDNSGSYAITIQSTSGCNP
jgi:hypothetical protein